MEVKYVILACITVALIMFIGGYILGTVHKRKIDGGQIIFSPGEEGPKCTIKFDCDEQELMQKLYIVLKIVHQNNS